MQKRIHPPQDPSAAQHMEVLKQRGNALYAQKKYDEAIKAYDEAIASLSVAAGSSSSSDEKVTRGVA